MMGLPHELLEVAGICIVGHIGSTVIAEMGGKLISTSWNLICYIAAAVIGLKYVWSGIHQAMTVVGGW